MPSPGQPSHPTSFADILALLDPTRLLDDNIVALLSDLVSLAEEDSDFIPYHSPRPPSGSSSKPLGDERLFLL